MNAKSPLWATCALLCLRTADAHEITGNHDASDALTTRALRIARQHAVETYGLETQIASAIEAIVLPKKQALDAAATRAQVTPTAPAEPAPPELPIGSAASPEVDNQAPQSPTQQSLAPVTAAMETLGPSADIVRLRQEYKAALSLAQRQATTMLAQSEYFTDAPYLCIWPMTQVGGWGVYEHEGNMLLIAEEAIGHNLSTVLRHELTHALEYEMSGGKPYGERPLYGTPAGQGDTRYFRQGHEVRAFAATVVEALKGRLPDGALTDWRVLEPYLRQSPDYVEAEKALRGKPSQWKLFHQAIYGLLANQASA